LAPRPTRRAFVEFHTRHKLLIMAHSPQHMRQMGKMIAGIKSHSLDDFRAQYEGVLMDALRLKTTRRKNTDVLFHVMGFFKKQIGPDEKLELVETIENYRLGHIPLIVPVTLLSHYVRKYDEPYLKEQFFLHPHPLELQLRNHV